MKFNFVASRTLELEKFPFLPVKLLSSYNTTYLIVDGRRPSRTPCAYSVGEPTDSRSIFPAVKAAKLSRSFDTVTI